MWHTQERARWDQSLLICDLLQNLNPFGILQALMCMAENQVYKDWQSMKRTCRLCSPIRIMLRKAIPNSKNTTLLTWFMMHRNWNVMISQNTMSGMTFMIAEKRKLGWCIGHIFTTNPLQEEHHNISTLLHHIAGAQSYDTLKTSPDGLICLAFKETVLSCIYPAWEQWGMGWMLVSGSCIFHT